MDAVDKKLVFGMLEYLDNVIQQKRVPAATAESLEVAMQCLSDSFSIDVKDATQKKEYSIHPEDLRSLLQKHLNVSTASASSTTSVDKEAAEKWKVEGNAKMVEKKYIEAIELYTRAISCFAKNAVYYANRAAAYTHLEKYQEAIDDCHAAIAVDPFYGKAYNRIAVAYHQLGQYKDAVEAYDKALEFDPNNEQLVSQRSASVRSLEGAEGDGAELDEAAAESSGGMPDMASLLSNPNMKGIFEKLSQNPNIMQMAQSMMQNMGSNGMPDLSSLMNNPQARQMMDSLMKGSNPRE